LKIQNPYHNKKTTPPKQEDELFDIFNQVSSSKPAPTKVVPPKPQVNLLDDVLNDFVPDTNANDEFLNESSNDKKPENEKSES